MFIAKRFDANYPHLAGHFARVIDNKITYAQSLIDDFSIAGKALTSAEQELLSTPLAAGSTLSITESWTFPAGVAGVNDNGNLLINYDQ